LDVLGATDKRKAQKISQRKYVEYLLRNGMIEEKRSLLASLNNKLLLTAGHIMIDTTHKMVASVE